MTHDTDKPIIIRRIKKIKKGGHHGGSWKIAYADFVTAMMAFFLLMWLLGLMNKYQLEGVAEYFKKPLKEAFTHESNQRGMGKNKDKEKFTEKYTEKEKEKAFVKADNPNDKMTDKQMSGQTAVPFKSIQEIKRDLETKLEKDPEMRQYKNQLNFQVTADGLKIELKDLENKPMFTKGRTDFEAYAKNIISWLSQQVNQYPNRVVIIGHTDALPYAETMHYSNWELSADRANATRRALIQAGLQKDKIIRVIGVSDTELLDKQHGINPSNRRIEIIIMTDDAMKKLIGK
jgi:chemotaxis protein MotB